MSRRGFIKAAATAVGGLLAGCVPESILPTQTAGASEAPGEQPTTTPAATAVSTEIPTVEAPPAAGLPNFEDPLTLAESAGLSAGRVFTYEELTGLGGPTGTTVEGLSVADIQAFQYNAKNLQGLIASTAGDSIDLNNIRTFWNQESGDRSRNTLIASTIASTGYRIFWLADRANNEFSFDPYSQMFNYVVDAESLGYDPLALPVGVSAQDINVRWFGTVPVVVVEKNGAISHVFNPEIAQFADLADFRQSSEVATADPNAKETWPSWAQEYWRSPKTATREQDTQFDQFITESRRAYYEKTARDNPELARNLISYMAEGFYLPGTTKEQVEAMDGSALLGMVEQMNPKNLLWLMIIHNAETKRKDMMSPNEYRFDMADKNAVILYWHDRFLDTGSGASYGLWKNWVDSIDDSLYRDVTSFSYTMDVFGKTITIPHFASHFVLAGDFVGIAELPGEAGNAMLVRIRNKQGQSFLYPFHITENPVKFDESMELCVGRKNGGTPPRGFGKFHCPDKTLDESRYAIAPRGDFENDFQPLTEDVLYKHLQWSPQFVRLQFYLSMAIIEGSSGSGVVTYHHPDSGLEIGQLVIFSDPTNFQNPP